MCVNMEKHPWLPPGGVGDLGVYVFKAFAAPHGTERRRLCVCGRRKAFVSALSGGEGDDACVCVDMKNRRGSRFGGERTHDCLWKVPMASAVVG